MKILIVEDEEQLADFMRQGLEELCYQVTVEHNGGNAFDLAASNTFDLIILDIMLPGRDGLSILKELRQQQITTPVIIVTARSETNQRIEGLELGADDYITKPFFMEELIARVKAVLRRTAGQPASTLIVGNLSVNLLTREVHMDNEEILLSPREFSLLEYLMRSPGHVFTRTQILEHVWGYGFDPMTNLVDVCIRRIRAKLQQETSPALIETVRGAGYRFRAEEND
ncbi:MAG: response regulator transcription factor [Spartobacteria bacterium]|nr:response regulator transcription factor [Spartobacteria bacterium]